jgi:hypothetical protein
MSPLQFFIILCVFHQINRVLVMLSGCFCISSVHAAHLSLKFKSDALGVLTLLFNIKLLLANFSVVVAMLQR